MHKAYNEQKYLIFAKEISQLVVVSRFVAIIAKYCLEIVNSPIPLNQQFALTNSLIFRKITHD